MSNSNMLLSFSLFFLFISFASSSSFNATHKCSPQQVLDLLLFKENLSSINETYYASYCEDRLGSDYYPIMMTWNKNRDCCKYYSMMIVVKGVEQVFLKLFVGYTIVDLSNNRFEGEIPGIIGHATSLKALNLSHNSLTGTIPYDFGNLLEIESLDLSFNQLTGEIPQSLADITGLEVLNLSQNNLVGRIPQGTQFITFNASFEGNPKLCGFPLPRKCEPPRETQLEVEGDEDEESGFTWRVVMMGFGCGTILGLVMGYLMLSTGRPKWFNAIADAGEHMIRTRKYTRRYVFIGK